MIHAITATRAFNEAKKREALSRLCRHCRSEQIAEDKKLNEPIICEKCGTEIPPESPAKRKTKEKRAK